MDHDAIEVAEAFDQLALAASRIAAVARKNDHMGYLMNLYFPVPFAPAAFAVKCEDAAGKFHDFARC